MQECAKVKEKSTEKNVQCTEMVIQSMCIIVTHRVRNGGFMFMLVPQSLKQFVSRVGGAYVLIQVRVSYCSCVQ